MCCGSGRSAWRFSATPVTPPPAIPQADSKNAIEAAAQADSEPVPSARVGDASGRLSFQAVMLRYRDSSAIRVRGPITGRAYDFSGTHPVQAVDVRDAAVLGRSRLFQQSAVQTNRSNP